MRKLYFYLVSIIFIGFSLCVPFASFGQARQLTMREFAVFGGFPMEATAFYQDSLSYGVNVANNGTVNGGAIGSYTFVTTGPNVRLSSDIYSGHRVRFGQFNSIGGSITAAINGRQSADVIGAGAATSFGSNQPYGSQPGYLTANGNINLSLTDTVRGAVAVPANNTYNGPVPQLGISNYPIFPQLPEVPANATWGTGGNGFNIIGTQTLSPGTYGDISVGTNSIITFNGPGRYIFDNIQAASTLGVTFVFNLQNNPNGLIELYVNGSVSLKNVRTQLIGGSAANIYTEVHSIDDFGFVLENGSNGSISFPPSSWVGTVWAPNSKIRVGGPTPQGETSVVIHGCLWSGQFVAVTGVTTINYVPLTTATNEVNNGSQLRLRDFAVFGGFPFNSDEGFYVNPNLNGVHLDFGNEIKGGAVGSYTFITSQFQNSLIADIYCGYKVNLSSFNNIGGSVTANIENFPGITAISDSGGNNYGNFRPYGLNPGDLSANGNIILDQSFGTVSGGAHLTDTSIYVGPEPNEGIGYDAVFPILPGVPTELSAPPDSFPGPNITSTSVLVPGTYNNLILSGGEVITFSQRGRYNFAAISSSATETSTFIFDFKNTESGLFQLYVSGDVNLKKINVQYLNGGSASRIYTEVHGDGSTNNGVGFAIEGDNSPDGFSNWEGTVWAPSSRISIGGEGGTGDSLVVVNGCLWSMRMVQLQGWGVIVNYAPLSINAEPEPTTVSPIIPYYRPPADGKVNDKIGSELYSLWENYKPGTISPTDFIFRVDNPSGKVMIEVIVRKGQYQDVLSALINTYGLTDTITNGPGSLIITGYCPIRNLEKLNSEAIAAKIDYCRPLFLPITNGGLVSTLGDSSMRAGLVRRGYNLTGAGVKVGVLSDSYDRALPNPASTSAANDAGLDLPATIEVIQDYPFGNASDEGRAMMQIIHDVAPGAELAFRTGFISAGDMAVGIGQLANDCDIIVDDVTYITEPFLKDGVIAKAVNNATTTKNVTYLSAAGNFGKKAYDGIFTGINPPGGFNGLAHDFGDGKYFQPVKVQPGNYTIVLQWVDDIYSLGETEKGGTQNDLDIYLVDEFGTILFGFNRINTGGDPLEILPFTVTGDVPLTANVLIVRNGGTTPNLRFKYVVFRGGLSFIDYGGASTLVGQANAANAIAVGAVKYDQTPPFGVNPSVIQEYSSLGGTLVNGVNRNKPDITGPDGGNGTVNIGPDADGDGRPNFFGTSAAAPHAAAVAALIKEGKQKFSSATISPAQMKALLKSSATDIGLIGFDAVTGSGLVNADSALRTFAKPQPHISTLEVVEPGVTPGNAPFTVSVKGSNLSRTTIIQFNGNPLPTAFVNNQELRASIPTFTGKPPVQLYTPPMSSSNLDGGYSNKRYFNEMLKKRITVKVNGASKKFGEQVPTFTSTVLVDGASLASSGLTLAGLKLNSLTYTTNATTSSDVGLYPISVINPLDPYNASDKLLLDKYDYEFTNGILQVLRLPLKITPKDTTMNYNNYPDIRFTYSFDRSKMPDPAGIEQIIKTQHKKFVADNVLAVLNGFGNGAYNADLQNMSILASFQALKNARNYMIRNGQLLPLTENLPEEEIGSQRFLVDVAARSVYNYKLNPSSSSLETAYPGGHSRALLGAKLLATGSATINLGNRQLRAMVNGQLMAMVNGQLMAMVNGQLMAIVNGQLSVLEDAVVLGNGQLQAIVNGVAVIIPNGQLQAMVNGQLFPVMNPVMVNGQLQAMVNGQLLAMVNGQLRAMVNGQLMPMVNGQLRAMVNGQLRAMVNGQLRAMVNGQLMALVNGELLIVEGLSIVNGQLRAMVNGVFQDVAETQLRTFVNGEIIPITEVNLANGQLQAMVNGQLQAVVNGQLRAMVNANNLGGINSNNNTAVIIDQDDVNLQDGSIGTMFSVNMTTGLNQGTQTIVPGAFTQENFDVTYGFGKLTVLPPTDFYTKSTGDLHHLATWGGNVDGSGANPTNFSTGKTFHLANRAAPYTMTANWTVDGLLDIPEGKQLKINGYTLSEAGLIGSGSLYGSPTSNLVVTGNTSGDAGRLKFAAGGDIINNLTINRTGVQGSATIGTPLTINNALTVTKGTLNAGSISILLNGFFLHSWY